MERGLRNKARRYDCFVGNLLETSLIAHDLVGAIRKLVSPGPALDPPTNAQDNEISKL